MVDYGARSKKQRRKKKETRASSGGARSMQHNDCLRYPRLDYNKVDGRRPDKSDKEIVVTNQLVYQGNATLPYICTEGP